MIKYIITVYYNKNYNYAYSKVDLYIIHSCINIPVRMVYSSLLLEIFFVIISNRINTLGTTGANSRLSYFMRYPIQILTTVK